MSAPISEFKFDFNQLKALHAIISTGTVAGAAKLLGVSSSAVSQNMTRLKTVLEDPLFYRSGQRLKPTALALQLDEQFRPLITELGNILTSNPQNPAPETAYTYKIISSELLEYMMVLPFATQLPASGSRLMMLPELANSEENLISLRNRAADILLTLEPATESSFVTERIFSTPLVVVSRINHPGMTQFTSLDQIQEMSFVERAGMSSPLKYAHYLATPWGHEKITIDFTLQSITNRLTLVSQTDLIILSPEVIARQFSEHIPVQIHPFSDQDIRPVHAYCVYLKSRRNDTVIKKLRESFMATANALSLAPE